ncbi:telomere-protecting terminal protein Tpg [Streptomyces fungicidicus]|uniref:telomere-protecting terminal protein Tpg n=1 Tax=Streptomyces fungicidicus TaxID=68203 RepID=UPI00367C6F51
MGDKEAWCAAPAGAAAGGGDRGSRPGPVAAPGADPPACRAEAEGFVFHTRARFGFAAPAGSSDDPRVRWITQYLPGEVARELFAARNAGAGEQQQLVILARALGHAFFRDGERRGHGLHIAFTDVEFAVFSIG